jgi:hypothetical protein
MSFQQERNAKLQKAERRQMQIKPTHLVEVRPNVAQRHLNLMSRILTLLMLEAVSSSS